jgi:hypothetical protein
MTSVRFDAKHRNPQGPFLFLIKILSAISALILIQKVLEICGQELWLQIVTLQSIAIILSPLIQLHWSKFGGITLLQNHKSNQAKIVFRSIASRLIVLSAVNIFMLYFLSEFFDRDRFGILYSSFFFASSTALSNEWYFLAKSDFKGFFLLESVPRFLCTCLPLIFIQTTSQLTILFVSLAFVNVATSVAILKISRGKSHEDILDEHSGQEKSKYIALQFVVFALLFSPVPIVNYFNFDDKFQFTIMERFLRLFMTAALPITQLVHSEILNSANMITVSQKWYRRSKLFALGILVSYIPSALFFLLITKAIDLYGSQRFMFLLFGILIMIVFTNRIIEEIFILNLNDMNLINHMQLQTLFILVASFAISVVMRSSNLLLTSLMLSELCRYLVMRKRLIFKGVLT